jgi:hypothetical protein
MLIYVRDYGQVNEDRLEGETESRENKGGKMTEK